MSYPDYYTPRLTGVLAEIYAERARQDEKWGEQNHPDGTGNLDQQRYAEFRRKWCQDAFGAGYGTWADVLAEEVAEAEAERDPARLRAELIQVAAVAVAWAEAIDRRTAAAKHPDAGPVISPRVAAHVLWQEGLGGHPAGSFTTALLKAWWAADPANGARLARTWPEYGAAIALLTQPGGSNRLRAIAGEQPAPDRP
jgi:hypothetical protein